MDTPSLAGLLTAGSDKSSYASLQSNIQVLCFFPCTGPAGTIILIKIQIYGTQHLSPFNGFASIGYYYCPINNYNYGIDSDGSTSYLISLKVPHMNHTAEVMNAQAPIALWLLNGVTERFDSIGVGVFVYTQPEILENTGYPELDYVSTLESSGQRLSSSSDENSPAWDVHDQSCIEEIDYPSKGESQKAICSEQSVPAGRSLSPTGTGHKSPQKMFDISRGYRRISKKALKTARNSNAVLCAEGDWLLLISSWTSREMTAKRRLVGLSRKREESSTLVSCRTTTGYTDDPANLFISCIFWESRKRHFITSTDLLCLIEFTTATILSDELKKRIRRNFEIYRPLVVRKADEETNDIYTTIMQFPNPRPVRTKRNVKLLPWECIPDALQNAVSYIGSISSSSKSSIITLSFVLETGGPEQRQ